MKVSYERTMERSYVKFEVPVYEQTYEEEMLKNKIAGVLPFGKEIENDRVIFTYDITQKQAFTEYIRQNELGVELISQLLKTVILHMKEAKNYLLESDNFMLAHEYIYVGDEGESFWLCYYIGYHKPMKEQLTELFEQWMKLIDYNNQPAVRLVYELYHQSRKSNCTYEELLEIVEHAQVAAQPLQEQNWKIGERKQMERGEKILALEEPICGEKEVLYYPFSCYIKLAVGILVGILVLFVLLQTTILQNRSGTVDSIKLLCSGTIVAAIEIICGQKIFHKNQKHSKMVPDISYVSMDTEIEEKKSDQVQQNENATYDNYINLKEEESTQLLYEEESTQILFQKKHLKLIPTTENQDPIVITDFDVTVGSSRNQAKVYLACRTISRTHARIRMEEEQYTVEDLNSTNGTFLNHQRLLPGKPEYLKNQDILQFAEYTYEVCIE